MVAAAEVVVAAEVAVAAEEVVAAEVAVAAEGPHPPYPTLSPYPKQVAAQPPHHNPNPNPSTTKLCRPTILMLVTLQNIDSKET